MTTFLGLLALIALVVTGHRAGSAGLSVVSWLLVNALAVAAALAVGGGVGLGMFLLLFAFGPKGMGLSVMIIPLAAGVVCAALAGAGITHRLARRMMDQQSAQGGFALNALVSTTLLAAFVLVPLIRWKAANNPTVNLVVVLGVIAAVAAGSATSLSRDD